MKAWPCGYAGIADPLERMADLGQVAQQRQAVGIVARLLLVATDDEGARHATVAQRLDEIGQVRPVADHPGRQVGHDPEPLGLEAHGRCRPSPRGPWSATP